MKISSAANYRDSVVTILTNEKLPAGDLPVTLENFFVALQNHEVIGVAGLEIYEGYGLLRSLMVMTVYRGQGIAHKLIEHIESLAISKNIREIYLLTETVPGYFKNKHYIQIERTDVPAEVQQSSEFSYVCPQSAIVMKKMLIKR